MLIIKDLMTINK